MCGTQRGESVWDAEMHEKMIDVEGRDVVAAVEISGTSRLARDWLARWNTTMTSAESSSLRTASSSPRPASTIPSASSTVAVVTSASPLKPVRPRSTQSLRSRGQTMGSNCLLRPTTRRSTLLRHPLGPSSLNRRFWVTRPRSGLLL